MVPVCSCVRQGNIIHCRIERQVYDLLTEYCTITGQVKAEAVRRAIRAYCVLHGIDVDDRPTRGRRRV